MPVFDFNNTPEEGKTPECTYTVFYSSEQGSIGGAPDACT